MYVIKFKDGTFHADSNKCVKLEEAKVYKNKNSAKSMISKVFAGYKYAEEQSEKSSESILGPSWVEDHKRVLQWYKDVNDRMLEAEICEVKITIV